MSEKRPEQDRSFDDEQQQMFGNEKAPAPDATRPPVGTQADPILPGSTDTTGGEGTHDEKNPPAK